MVEPADGAARDLEALLDREVDISIRNNDISSFCEGRDDGRNRRECLGVEDSIFCPKEICNIFLQVGVNVDCAVETCWTAASETVFPQSLGRLLFDVFVAGETGEVEAGEVHDCLSRTDEFGLEAGWTRDDRNRGEVQTLPFGKWLFERFWSPFVNEFVDFLVVTYQQGR